MAYKPTIVNIPYILASFVIGFVIHGLIGASSAADKGNIELNEISPSFASGLTFSDSSGHDTRQLNDNPVNEATSKDHKKEREIPSLNAHCFQPGLFNFSFLHEFFAQSEEEKIEQLNRENGFSSQYFRDPNPTKLNSLYEEAQRGNVSAMKLVALEKFKEENYLEGFHWSNLAGFTVFLRTGLYDRSILEKLITPRISQVRFPTKDRATEFLNYLNYINRLDCSKDSFQKRAECLILHLLYVNEGPRRAVSVHYCDTEINDILYQSLANMAETAYLWDVLIQEYSRRSPLTPNKIERITYYSRKSGSREAIVNLGNLIRDSKINEDIENQVIRNDEERIKAAAACYRRSKTPEALCNLGVLILKGGVFLDEEGNAFESYEAPQIAARCFRKAQGSKKALSNLGTLIETGQTDLDETDKPINSEEERVKAAARCYQSSKEVPSSLHSFAALLMRRLIDVDIDGKKITNDIELFKLAGDYYLYEPTPASFNGFGVLVHYGKINFDETNHAFRDEERYKVAARCYLRAITAESKIALSNLAILMAREQIDFDENKRKLSSQEERIAACERCCGESGVPAAFYNLAVTLLASNFSQATKEKAIEYTLKSFEEGYDEAIYLYYKLLDTSEPSVDGEVEVLVPINGEAIPVPASSAEALDKAKGKEKKKKHYYNKNKEYYKKLSRGELSLEEAANNLISPYFVKKKNIVWEKNAKAEFKKATSFQGKRIGVLIKGIIENNKRGKPETLQAGIDRIIMSRRVDKEHRLVYEFDKKTNTAFINSCLEHYKRK